MSRVNLVLTSIHIEDSPRAVPLGPAMLASALKKDLEQEIHTEILNFYLNQSPAVCINTILEHAPDCVGLSMYIWNRDLCLEIAALLKQENPDITIFAGGPEASADYKGILENNSIDFILPGEGEEIIVQAMTHLLKSGDPKQISKIISPAPIKDLSSLPSPFLDQTFNPTDYSGMLWELSRGCPFKCDFCYESRGTAGIRRFPQERIRAELQLFEKAKVEQVFVLDPTFNYNKDTAKDILKLILKESPEMYFFFEVRSEFIDEEMAGLFAAVNCSLQIGMQSAHNDVLQNINRKIDTEDFENKILLLHESGAVYGFDLIYGLPGDTFEGFCASIDFAMSLAPNHIDIFPLAVLPGTRLHETASSLGLKYEASNPYRVISSKNFEDKDIQLSAEMAHAFDLFYNTGKAVPWFSIIINVLDMTPSAFFNKLANWMKTNPTEDIIDLQKRFVSELLRKHKKDALITLANDIITLFGYLDTPDEDKIAQSSTHNPANILEHLDSGITDLEELYSVLLS